MCHIITQQLKKEIQKAFPYQQSCKNDQRNKRQLSVAPRNSLSKRMNSTKKLIQIPF